MEKKIYIPYPNGTNPTEITLWLDELPLIKTETEYIELNIKANCNTIDISKKYAIELDMFTGKYNYGLLGFEYNPQPDRDSLKITVDYTNNNSKLYEKTIAYCKNTVFIGLSKRYADVVLTTAQNFFTSSSCIPRGVMNFNVAANSEIGSSQMMFKWLTEILLKLLINNNLDINEEELTELLMETFQNKDY